MKNEPIAIVGMAALLPKSQNLAEYWQNIVTARDCTTTVPDDHSWRIAEHYDPDPKTPDKTYSRRGGFLDKVPFDPLEFGLPPTVLDATDSSQLLSLIVAREALRDAGLDPDGSWDRSRTSVILGATGTQELAVTLGSRLHGPTWRKAMLRCGVDPSVADTVVADIGNHFPAWQEQSFPGLLGNVIAGRIANRFDLGGTNCVVDAACASSLAAMELALAELWAGKSDIAISGGVDALNDIFMFMCFSKTPALSRTERARPFDIDGDGILIAEGVAMLVMKRLSDAERAGDRIYAVIRGIGSSSDGRYKSIYAPNSVGQTAALRRAYEDAEVPLESIELVEAHGTGTKAGDAAEVEGLTAVYADSTRAGRHVAIGTIKSQIGHTKSTAGAAGVLKAALALYHRVLPPTAQVDLPNPKMHFEDSKLYVNTLARPWIRAKDHPRRAGVSAFGFGGSNFHVVLEEYGDPDLAVSMAPATEHLFLFGAADAHALATALAHVDPVGAVADASRRALEAWRPSPHVIAFTADDTTFSARLAAAKRLAAAGPGEQDEVRYAVPDEAGRRLGLLFPGQGSQYVNMGRTLALRQAPFRAALDRADEAMRLAGADALSERIYPPPVFDEVSTAGQAAALTATATAQPAIGAVSKGMLDLLARFGVRPDAVAGHSYGEVVALHAAGVLDEDALWTVSRLRGEAMGALDGDRGTMAAVGGDLDAIAAVLASLGDGVVLANRNHAKQGVISGSRVGVRRAVDALAAQGIAAKEIPVAAAFHSSLVADAAGPFGRALADIPFRAPSIPVYSDTTAAAYPADPDAARALLAGQLAAPVDFLGVVEAMWRDGVRTFVEVGPKGVLGGLLRQILRGRPGGAFVSLDRDEGKVDGDAQFKRALAVLATRGLPIDVAALLREPAMPPALKAGSKATVWLGGANYLKPDTKNPPPPKARPVPPKASMRVERPVDVDKAPAPRDLPVAKTVPPVAAAPVARPAAAVAPAAAPVAPPRPVVPASPRAPTPASGAPMSHPTDASAIAALLESTRQSLAAFQSAQERTAQVHAMFLESHTKANDGFGTLFATHARLVGAALGLPDVAPALSAVAPAPVAPVFNAPTPIFAVSAPVAVAAPAPTSTLAFAAASEAVAGSFLGASNGHRVSPPPGARPAVAVEADVPTVIVPAAPKARPAPPAALPQPGGSRASIVRAMLDTVAEKTGYPSEMLELGMDLESDLGVDSIKRVEILSAVQERVPGLPALDNEKMSALRTVGDVVDYLAASLPAGSAPTAAPTAPPAGAARDAIVRAMLSTVAEKTGYPADMLEMGMDLESDLGVDSIKRVEILSAVQERVPGLPALDNEKMSALRTVGDVVDYLAASLPGGAPAAGSARDAIVAAMLGTVSAKTGYPADMLEMGMDLESDLGVDSIKRVEILSAVQEQIPGLPELDNDAMSALRTVGDVVAYLVASLGEAPAPTPVADLPARKAVLVTPAPSARRVSLRGRCVVVADRLGLADSLVDALRARGVEANTAPDVAAADGAEHVVYLGAFGAPADQATAAVRAAFDLARRGARATFVVVTGAGGGIGHVDARGPAVISALPGLTKTLVQEWEGTRAVTIDVDPDRVSVEALADEIVSDRGVTELGLHPTRGPVTIVAEPAPLRDGPHAAPIAAGELVVVTGGARGVTAAVVVELARRWRPYFLLLGRSEITDDPAWAHDVDDAGVNAALASQARAAGEKLAPKELARRVSAVKGAREARHTVARIRALGSDAMYVAVDVRDRDAVAAAVSRAVGHRGPVRGVVHGAGVIADKRVLEKTDAQFEAVWSTKVDGLSALLAAVDPGDLRFAAMFGSVAGRYGNRGQVDYAMANEVLARAARDLRSQGVQRAICFDWGPWEGGMVDEALAKQMKARGMPLVSLLGGAIVFADELERREPPCEVVYGGPHEGGPLVGPDPGARRPAAPAAAPVVGVPKLSPQPIALDPRAPWLDDHRIGGKAVVPTAMVIEWVTAVARGLAGPLPIVAVRDVTVLRGIIVEAPMTAMLSWSEQPARLPGGRSWAFEIHLEGSPAPRWRASVDAGLAAMLDPGDDDVADAPFPHPVAEAYARGLFHGPAYQAITGFRGWSNRGITATVRPSVPVDLGAPGDAWATDPVVLDAALQAMLLWVRETTGLGCLPSAVGTLHLSGDLSSTDEVRVRMRPIDAHRGRFDVVFRDVDGRPVATLTDGAYTASAGLIAQFRRNAA